MRTPINPSVMPAVFAGVSVCVLVDSACAQPLNRPPAVPPGALAPPDDIARQVDRDVENAAPPEDPDRPHIDDPTAFVLDRTARTYAVEDADRVLARLTPEQRRMVSILRKEHSGWAYDLICVRGARPYAWEFDPRYFEDRRVVGIAPFVLAGYDDLNWTAYWSDGYVVDQGRLYRRGTRGYGAIDGELSLDNPEDVVTGPLEAVEITPLQAATALMWSERPDAAVNAYQSHLAANPGDYKAMVHMGLALIESQRNVDGAAVLLAAFMADPGLMGTVLDVESLGLTSSRLREVNQQAALASQRRGTADAQLAHAFVLRQTGNPRAADRVFERAAKGGLAQELVDAWTDQSAAFSEF